jgi:hypothetical protein
LACPYFIPEKRSESELWLHRARLPLGDGYEGRCSAPGHEDVKLTDEELRLACNLGNACCSRLPADRALDSIRFHVKQDLGSALMVQFCTEREHHPREHGLLQFDAASGTFVAPAAQAQVVRLAQAFVQSHLERHPRANSART